MRILQVSSARIYGGCERHFVDLARGLANRGHEVYVAYRPTSEWKHELDFLPRERHFKVSIRNSFGVLSAIRLADFIRTNQIDVVHAHVARDFIPASIATMGSPARFVLTRHLMLPLKSFNRFALKNVSKTIAVSDGVANELKKLFPKEKIVVIHNGIDVGTSNLQDIDELRAEFRSFHSIPSDALLVGTRAELKESKGQTEFILAAAEVAKAVPNCRFVVVGRDNSLDKKYRRDLKRLAVVLGIEERFLWLDWLDDTRPFYSAIDVFVSPARSESYGLGMLEAMASGTPIVATETEAAFRLLGINGELVPVEDPVALANAISSVLNDAVRCREIAEHNLKRAGSIFDAGRMVQETEELYRSLLQPK